MKHRSILTAAVLSFVISASSFSAPYSSGYTASAVEQGKQIAAANGIVLGSDEAAASLTVLNNANNGTLPALEFNDKGDVTCIIGPVSGRNVSGKQNAESVVKSVSALLGITDFDHELVFADDQTSLYNRVFCYQQFYRGIPVESGYVSLVVDKETGIAQYLNSSFAAGLSFDVTPAVSSDLARALIREAAGTGVVQAPELVIRRVSDSSYKLAWRGFTGNVDAETVYIDAQNGDLLNAVSANKARYEKTFTAHSNPVLGACNFSVTIEQLTDKTFRMHDPGRYIWIGSETRMNDAVFLDWLDITDAQRQEIAQDSDVLFHRFYNKLTSKSLKSDTLFSAEDASLGTLAQVEKAYDFYANTFNWYGTDGKRAELFVNAGTFFGSCASDCINYIELGVPRTYYGGQKPDAYNLDCVIHEYTHRVTANKVKWSFSQKTTEAGALNEGYSDIMAEYGHLRDWKTLAGTTRNATKCPSSGKITLNYSSDPKYCTYQYYNLKPYLEDQRNLTSNGYTYYIDCHNGSTIISHAAYLMEKYGIPSSICKEVWYNSMDYLPKGSDFATFNSCRNAVINCALDQVLNKYSSSYTAAARNKYKAYARMAFNAVGIKLSYRKMGDVNFDGRVNSDDVNLITLIARGKYSPDVETMAVSDVDYDGRITNGDAETISRAILNGTTGSL